MRKKIVNNFQNKRNHCIINSQGGVRMKKVKRMIMVFSILAMLPLGVFAKEKVNVYLFKREGCGYCASALNFFNKLSEDEEYKNYFQLVTKETLNNKTNSDLMEKVASKLGVALGGVPFIVIGDTHFEGYDPQGGFDEQIKQAIKKAYENETQDIVASINEKKDTSATTLVILIAVAAGVIFLIYMAKDANSMEEVEETKEEIVKEKVVSKKKTQTKKPTTKKTTSKSSTTKKTNKK